MSLLITRPRHDLVTHYLYHWTEELVQEATKRGVKVFELQKEKAIKKHCQSYVRKQAPAIVIFNGHGNEDCVTGHDNEILLDLTDDHTEYKDIIVYMRACSAGKNLGPLLKPHVKAFIGYTEPYKFWSKSDIYFKKPLEDPLAQPFKDSSNQVGLSLIKGRSSQEAHEDSLKVYNKEINRLLTSASDEAFILPELIWNMSCQVYLSK